MLKGSDLIGVPVLASDSGEALQQTQDIIVSLEHQRLAGFLIAQGGWAGQAQVVPWSNVLSASPSAIVVRSSGSIVDARTVPDLQRILESDRRLRGTRVCTTDGIELGIITDLFFSRKTGETQGYEVCGRLLGEATSHCVFLSVAYPLNLEGRTAWVSPDVIAVVKRQIENARQVKLAQPAANGQPGYHVRDDIRDSRLMSLADLARGRHLLWDIRSPEGYLIAARGQQVTEAVFQRAVAHNRLRELLRATGVTLGGRQESPDKRL